MKLVVNPDRKKLWLYALGSILFVAIGIMMYGDSGSGLVEKCIAVLCVAFFGVAFMIYALYAMSSRPLIVADEHGIQFRILWFSTGQIAWPDILGFRIEKRTGNIFLVASLDPEWLKRYALWKRWLFRLAETGAKNRISFYSVMLSESPEELLPKLRQMHRSCLDNTAGVKSTPMRQPYRNDVLGWLLIASGSVLIAGCGYWIVYRVIRWSPRWDEEKQVARVMVIAGGYLIWIGQRLLSRTADLQLVTDTRAPVVYFRSFSDDDDNTRTRAMNFGFAETTEQSLASLLGEFGPVVALGRPGDRLPVLGAYRKYVDDDQWQEIAEEWLRKASLVILRLGCTESFFWELDAAIRLVEPSRILIYYPQPLWRKEHEQYQRVVEQAALRFPGITWPKKPGDGQLFVLGNDLKVSCIPSSASYWAYIRGWARFNSDAPHLLVPFQKFAERIGVRPPKLPLAPYEYVTIPLMVLMLMALPIIAAALIWVLVVGK